MAQHPIWQSWAVTAMNAESHANRSKQQSEKAKAVQPYM
jgi:hypothetical protein